jgi:hypothetical protein
MSDIHSISKPASKSTQPRPVASEPDNATSALLSPQHVVRLQSTIGNAAVRRMVTQPGRGIQRAVSIRLMGQTKTTTANDIDTLCTATGITVDQLAAEFKTKLFAGALFPAPYKQSYDQNEDLQAEMKQITADLDDLVAANVSNSVIVASSGDANAVAAQLFPLVSPSINAVRLNRYTHYKTATTLGNVPGTSYLTFLETIKQKLTEYQSQFGEYDYDESAQKMRHRITKYTEYSDSLKQALDTAINANQGPNVTGPIIQRIEAFMAEISTFEKAWDLDFFEEAGDLESVVETNLAQNEALGDKYKKGGGVDDGESVGDRFRALLACSLHAILAVKPGWLGAETPSDLHEILRKTGKLKDYDEDRTAAKIRYLAGMTPVNVAGQNKHVSTFLAEEAEKKNPKSYIIDAAGVAHTFAAKWDGAKYLKVDEQTPGGNPSFGQYANKKALTVWN